MEQIVFNKELQEVARRLKTANSQFTANDYWSDDRKIVVNRGKLSKDEVDALLAVVDREAAGMGPNKKHHALISQKLHDWISLSEGITDDTLVKKLELLPAALKGYFQETKHKWIFIQQEDDTLVPFFFADAAYRKGHMERGEDIQQNAIAGAFLRLLEYYRGVIFMTSNRGDEIDDAILSRATAWIRYEKPDADMQKELWQILGAQYGAVFTEAQLLGIMSHLPEISGRTIRNLLKLARMLVGPEGTIGEATIRQVANYQVIN